MSSELEPNPSSSYWNGNFHLKQIFRLRDADPDAKDDERGAEDSGRGSDALAEGGGGGGRGGEGDGVGDGDGNGDGRGAEEREEGCGRAQVGGERRRVLPRQEQGRPPPEHVAAGRVGGTGAAVPDERAPPHERVCGAPHQTHRHHARRVAATRGHGRRCGSERQRSRRLIKWPVQICYCQLLLSSSSIMSLLTLRFYFKNIF